MLIVQRVYSWLHFLFNCTGTIDLFTSDYVPIKSISSSLELENKFRAAWEGGEGNQMWWNFNFCPTPAQFTYIHICFFLVSCFVFHFNKGYFSFLLHPHSFWYKISEYLNYFISSIFARILYVEYPVSPSGISCDASLFFVSTHFRSYNIFHSNKVNQLFSLFVHVYISFCLPRISFIISLTSTSIQNFCPLCTKKNKKKNEN